MREFQKAGEFEFLSSRAGRTRCSVSTTIWLSSPILFLISFEHVVLIAIVVREKFSIIEHCSSDVTVEEEAFIL